MTSISRILHSSYCQLRLKDTPHCKPVSIGILITAVVKIYLEFQSSYKNRMRLESVLVVFLAFATILISSSSSAALNSDDVPFDPKHPEYFLKNLVSSIFDTNKTGLQWSVRGHYFPLSSDILIHLRDTKFDGNPRFYVANRTDLVSVKETMPDLYEIRFPLGMYPYRVNGNTWVRISDPYDGRKTREGTGPINIVAKNSSIFDVEFTYDSKLRVGRINKFKFLFLRFGKWANTEYDVIFPRTNCPLHRVEDDKICKDIRQLIARHLQGPDNVAEEYMIDQMVRLFNTYLKK